MAECPLPDVVQTSSLPPHLATRGRLEDDGTLRTATRVPVDEEGPPPYETVVNIEQGYPGASVSTQLHTVQEEQSNGLHENGLSGVAVSAVQRPSLDAILPRDFSRLSHLRDEVTSRTGSQWSTLCAGPQLVPASALGSVYTGQSMHMLATQFLLQEDVRDPPSATRQRRLATCCWLSCVMHIVTWLCLFLLIWIYATREERYMFVWEYSLHMGVTGVFLIIGLIFVIFELWQAEPTGYMTNNMDLKGAQAHAKQLRRASPKVFVEVAVVTTRYYPGGDTDQMIIYRDKKRMFIDYWRDFSKDLELNTQMDYPMAKLKIKTAVCFLDEATMNHYENLAAKMQEKARRKMKHGHRLVVKPYMEIPENKETVGVWAYGQGPRRYILAISYWFISLLLCTYPVRLLIRKFWMGNDHQVYTVAKAVGIINY